MSRFLQALIPLLTSLLLGLPAHASSTQQGVLVVYLGADDCRWCTFWESRLSGAEARFKATPEFKQLQYRTVKNTWLDEPYIDKDFPSDLKWVFESIPQRDRRPPRPTFLLYNNGTLVGKYAGSEGWAERGFPAVQKLLASQKD